MYKRFSWFSRLCKYGTQEMCDGCIMEVHAVDALIIRRWTNIWLFGDFQYAYMWTSISHFFEGKRTLLIARFWIMFT